MGLLDSIVGALGQGQGGGGGGNAALLNMVVGMLANSGGGAAGAGAAGGAGNGLGALVEQFTKGGLGDVVGSWVSTGQNLPVSPEQLGSVFGGQSRGFVWKYLQTSRPSSLADIHGQPILG